MLQIQVTNRAAFLYDMQRWSKGMSAGVSSGIQEAGRNLVVDASQHVPVKSGKAQASVMMEIRSPFSVVVGYAKEVTWYMKIIELSGAISHPIIPRGRLGSADARKVGAYLRKNKGNLPANSSHAIDFQQGNWLGVSSASGPSSRSVGGKLLSALRAAGVDEGRLSALTGPGGSFHQAKALTIGGGLFSWAKHPGMKPRHILRERLMASESAIRGTVQLAVEKELVN